MAAEGAARKNEPRRERQHLPVPAANPLPAAGGRARGGWDVKAARLHTYHDPLAVDAIDEQRVVGLLDVVVRIGAAGLCRTDLPIQKWRWDEMCGVTLP